LYEPKNFSEKVALATGGTSGIGKTTATEFARAGAKVVLSGRREKEGADVVAEIQQLGGAAAFIRADVAKDADVKAMVDFTVATYASKQGENTSFIRTRKKSHLRTMAASLTCTYHFPTR